MKMKAEIGVIYIQVKKYQEEAPEAKKTEGRSQIFAPLCSITTNKATINSN